MIKFRQNFCIFGQDNYYGPCIFLPCFLGQEQYKNARKCPNSFVVLTLPDRWPQNGFYMNLCAWRILITSHPINLHLRKFEDAQ